MDHKELKKLVATLRSMGLTHYKSGDIELHLGPEPLKPQKPSKAKPPETDDPEEIPHVIQDLKSVMALSDEALVDRLFPLPTEEPTEDA